MQVLPARFIFLLAVASIVLQSSGLPLPEQNAIIPNEAAPLEADDDPARLRRYKRYGLEQMKVQRVQLASNVHPDAAPFLSSPGVAQTAANPTGAAQGNAGVGAAYSQPAGINPSPQTGAASFGDEASRSQRAGMAGIPLPDQSASQVGTMQVGQDVGETAGVAGTGELSMSPPGGAPEMPPQSGGYPPVAGMDTSTRPAAPEVADANTPERNFRSPVDTLGVASSAPGAGSAAGMPQVAAVRPAVPDLEQGGAQFPNTNAANMAGMAVAQSKGFNGKETSSLQLGERLDDTGTPSLPQRPAAVSADAAGSAAYVNPTQQSAGDMVGSQAQVGRPPNF